MGFFREDLSNDVQERARRQRRGAAHRRRRLRHARVVRPTRLEGDRLRRRRAVLDLPRAGAGRRRGGLAGAGIGGRRQRRRRASDASAEAVRGANRIAVRPQGRRRPHRPADARRRAAARPPRRVLGQAAAGRRARGVCAASGGCSATSPSPVRSTPSSLPAGSGPTPGSGRRFSSKISACASRQWIVRKAVVIDSSNGIVSEALEAAARGAVSRLGLQPIPVFTYLANSIRKGDRTHPVLAHHGDRSEPAAAGWRASSRRGRPAPTRSSSTNGRHAS